MMADPVHEIPDMMMTSDDDAAVTGKWCSDSARTLVMRPASFRDDFERYMRHGVLPLSFKNSVILSAVALALLLVAILAAHS